jgi:hypothetical protein
MDEVENGQALIKCLCITTPIENRAVSVEFKGLSLFAKSAKSFGFGN